MNLKLLRKSKGLRQQDIANALEVRQQRISELENTSVDNLTLGTLYKLSKVLNVGEIELHELLIKDIR